MMGTARKLGLVMSHEIHQYLCIHGHFYQPPRDDPFTHRIPFEPGAAPYDNFNEKITAECYRPNADLGTFELISFDMGPTLAMWLEQKHPAVYRQTIEADLRARERNGVGNAMAHAYFHTILPLATVRDKRTQIIWGLRDFEHRFGRQAEGLWLPETAVDMETLDILAEQGVRYTILAPWQAVEHVDSTEPYLVKLPTGRSIAAFFFHWSLSGAVSFDASATSNADCFAMSNLLPQFNAEKQARGEDQIIIVATDGETFGHHKPYRDRFLSYLVRTAAPRYGMQVVSLGAYLRTHPPAREVHLKTPSSWSCVHGVDRWGTGCTCTAGDTAWKPALRSALDRLSARLNDIYERYTAPTLLDPWAARDGYIDLRNGSLSPGSYWAEYGLLLNAPHVQQSSLKMTRRLLEAQYFGQCMYTSCGWFFDDLDGIESRNNIAFARKAISLTWHATGIDLQQAFLADLASIKSTRSALTGASVYLGLSPLTHKQLPLFSQPEKVPAA